MGLFNNYNEIEKRLLEQYSQMFSMMGMPDAKKIAKDMLNRSIEQSRKAGTYVLPSNFGDIILKEEKAEEPKIEKVAEIYRRVLPQKINEGARAGDIKWWWNLNDVERHMMLNIDDLHKGTLFLHTIKNSEIDNREKAGEEASRTVWQFHPIYTSGDPNIKPQKAPSGIKREDFPLPIELKDRINRYIEKRAKTDPEEYKKNIESSFTFNALIRKEIKNGNL